MFFVRIFEMIISIKYMVFLLEIFAIDLRGFRQVFHIDIIDFF